LAGSRSALINVMVRAAEKAARTLVRDFGEVEQLQVSKKGPADFVSSADLAAEKSIRAELSKARPDFGWLMEESGKGGPADARSRWIVDPLDGTTNFLHGVPHWSISIAAEIDGAIAAGIVYDPVKNELFWAERGQGAFMNSTRLRVSGRRSLDIAMIATGMPFKGHKSGPNYTAELDLVMGEVAGVRRFGSAALDLAYVASGRFDGFWEYGLSPWDTAAGVILVTEAGGFVREIGGGTNPVFGSSIIAANSDLGRPLGDLLRRANEKAPGAGQAPKAAHG
jgi:myo-inositol-1(or 4)-monophosphatase